MEKTLKAIPHYIAKLSQDLGFLHERKYRDYCIREEFTRLKDEGMKIEEIEQVLSQQFSSEQYPLTPESIHDIVYRKSK